MILQYHPLTFSGLAPKLRAFEVASTAARDRGSRSAAERGSLAGGRAKGSIPNDEDDASSDFLEFFSFPCFTLEVPID